MRLLTKEEIIDIADRYDIEPELIMAVDRKESRGSGFYLEDGPHKGEVKILFEGHHFRRLTKRKYDRSHPHLSYLFKDRRQYYRRGQLEFDRLLEAIKLDATAALMSASFGRYQIMGFNFQVLGYSRVQEMVTDFYRGEDRQLDGFISFLKNTRVRGHSLLNHLRNKNFEAFALGYNGASYKVNNYHTDIERFYNELKK